MKKTVKFRADTLEEAKTKFKEEISENVFVLKTINEFGTYKPTYDTGFSMGDTVEEAIESAKKRLPDPYFIKGEVVPELEANTNVRVPVIVKADSEWSAKSRADDYIKNRFFPNAGFGEAKLNYAVVDNQLTKKGFKGVIGIGKQEDTYTVTFFIKPKVKLKYSMWSYIVAEITDEIRLANNKLLELAQYGSFDSKGIEHLISQGVDINYCDANGRNVLFYSCHDYKISKFLIDKGVDFRKTDNVGDNILTYCLRGDCKVHNKTREFLENNGIEQDKSLLNELTNLHARDWSQRRMKI
jgi:hypothetical protein